MASLNRVTIIGNLCADPELKQIPSGKSVCHLRLATNESFKDASGQKQERTEFHRATIWGAQAESCAKYLSKGSQVYLEGRLETRSWEKDGQKHSSTEISADRVQFLGGRGESRSAPPGQSPPDEDDQVPF